MSNNAEFPQPYGAPYDDEISISELLMKLWAKRGLIVVLPLVLAGLTVVGLLAGKTLEQSTVSYFIELKGIYLGDMPGDSDVTTTRYPNGTLFSPQDLLHPSVLQALAGEFDLDPLDLAEHIDVDFGTPVSNGVLAEYRAALSQNSKASAEDIAAINARYQAKLDAAAKRGLKITVDFGRLEIEKAAALQVAERLPKLWTQVYTTQFMTTLSPEIIGFGWTAPIDLDSMTGLQEADVQLTLLQKGTELIRADGRLRGLITEGGATAANLLGYLDDFRSIFFEPIYLEAFEQDNPLSRVYQQDLTLQITKLNNQINELNARLLNIRDFQTSGRGNNTSSVVGDRASLDGSALSVVVSLAERAALSTYLQETLDKRYALTEELTELEAKLQRIAQEQGQKTQDTVSNDFRTMGQQRYESIVQAYAELLQKAQTLSKALTPEFYAVMTQPAAAGSNLFEKRDLLFIALALALGGMLAIVAALLWPARENP